MAKYYPGSQILGRVLVAQWCSECVSRHNDQGSIPAPCSYQIKVILVTCEKSVVQFDSTKHRRFSPGTLVSSCSNTRPMRGGPGPPGRTAYVADRVIQYK